MKLKTKWQQHNDHWDLSVEVNIDGAVIFTYLAAIESIFGEGLISKKVYIITDLFGDYHPEPCSYFWDKEFAKLKDAKVFVEKEVAKGLSEMAKQVRALK